MDYESSRVELQPPAPSVCFSRKRGLQHGDVNLDHLHHRVRCPLRLGSIGIGHHLAESSRNNLPGETETILQPAASLGGTALNECAPITIELGLIVTVHDEGH